MTTETVEKSRLEQLVEAQRAETEAIQAKTKQINALNNEIKRMQQSVLIRAGRIDELQLQAKEADDG